MTDGQILLESIEWLDDIAESFVLAGDPGRAILVRVSTRLRAQLDAYLFGACLRLQTEQQAMAYVRTMALELKRGSDALLVAAETLKSVGRGYQANLAYQAHKALAAKASEVLSG